MALKGIKVIELAGLAPVPFCGMILSDFGANVIRVDRTTTGGGVVTGSDQLARGKRSIVVDLKKKEGVEVVKKLSMNADVLLEPFRQGVMGRLGLGPEILLADNPRLVYASLTGYGQAGPMSKKAGHDINYLSIAGVLSFFGRKNAKPHAPVNFAADFAGGGLICALGVVMALLERTSSGKGQVIDASMVEGAAYVGSFLWRTQSLPLMWGKPRGENLLDGGAAFYDTYETKDGKYVSVGALEPQFFQALITGLQLQDEVSQFDDPEEMKEKFTRLFLTKTRDQWVEVFKDLDACVAPVLDMVEMAKHPHNIANKSFLLNDSGSYEPGPAPRLSRTPGVDKVLPQPVIGQDTTAILQEIGLGQSEIEHLLSIGAVEQTTSNAKL